VAWSCDGGKNSCRVNKARRRRSWCVRRECEKSRRVEEVRDEGGWPLIVWEKDKGEEEHHIFRVNGLNSKVLGALSRNKH